MFKFGDGLVMAIIFLDFLQFLAMGPDLSGYDKISTFMTDYASANLASLIEFKGKYY